MRDLIRRILKEETVITPEGPPVHIEEPDRKFYIYKTTFINGKIYIGKDFEKGNIYSSPFYFGSFNRKYVYEDLIKSGWDLKTQFPISKKEILWENDTPYDPETNEHFGFLEHRFIRYYESNNPDKGYNRTGVKKTKG